jgi:hypothetical protein
MKVLNEAKEWSQYARERFGIYGSEHSGSYFKPNMAKSLDHLDALVMRLEDLDKSLREFKNDLSHASEVVQYNRESLVNWLSDLLDDPSG